MAKPAKKWLRCSASGRIIAYVGMKRWGDLGEWSDELSQRMAQRWLDSFEA